MKPWICLGLAATAAAIPVSLRAQTAEATNPPPGPPAATPSSGDDAAIIVTARRREENIEKVPITITALGREQLQSRSVFSETDLQSQVPGLTVAQTGNANQFNYAIRGQSVDTYTNSPPGVLSYIDDVQVVQHSAMVFYDLEGIQVLKGPQGTLFGRNSTGGAVLFQTARPTSDFTGYIDGRYGSYDLRHLEGAVSAPVGDGGSGFRLAGSYDGGGAYVTNIGTDEHLGRQDRKSVRGTLTLKPLSGLSNATVVQYTHEGGNNTPSETYSAYACGATYKGRALVTTAGCLYSPGSPGFDAYIAAHPNIYPGGIVAFADLQRQRGPWVSDVSYPMFHHARSVFAINTTTWDASPTLTIKNILGYNNSKSRDGFDYDGSPYFIFQNQGLPNAAGTTTDDPFGFGQYTRSFSEELQGQGKALDNRLIYVVGAYYLRQKDSTDSPLYAFDFSPIAPGTAFTYHARNGDRSVAVFAQGTYKLTDLLNLTGGIRYTWEHVSEQQLANSAFGTGVPIERRRDSKPSWTVSLDYQVAPALLAYVTTRGSWRAGGYNYSVAPVNTTAGNGGNAFGPETTEDVEVGAKYSGRTFGVPLTLNADVFNQWVKNVQRAAYVPDLITGGPTLFTANVPRAVITGVEADGSVRPASWLLLGLSGAFVHARYTDGDVTLLGTPTSYGPFADNPRWTGTAYGEVSHTLPGDAGKLTLRADVYGQTHFYFSNVAGTVAPDTRIPGYALVNLRLSWNNVLGEPVTASVFARNVGDRRYWTGGNASGNGVGYNTASVGQPRMIGGELRYSF